MLDIHVSHVCFCYVAHVCFCYVTQVCDAFTMLHRYVFGMLLTGWFHGSYVPVPAPFGVITAGISQACVYSVPCQFLPGFSHRKNTYSSGVLEAWALHS